MRSVDARGLDKARRDRLERGEDNQGREGEDLPDRDEEHRAHRHIGVVQPQNARVDEADRAQGVIEDAVFRIEDPYEDQGHRDLRRRPGNEDDRTHQAAAGEGSVHQQRCREAEDDRTDDAADRIDCGVGDCPPEEG